MTTPAEIRRLSSLLWGVLLLLWGVQVWRPQLSYPRQGVLEALLALGILGMGAALAFLSRRRDGTPSGPLVNGSGQGAGTRCQGPGASITAALGLGFVLYAWLRWAAQGFPAAGSDNFGTLVGCAVAAASAFFLLGAWRQSRDAVAGVEGKPPSPGSASESGPDTPAPLLTVFYAFLSLVALACGLHALAQHQFLYDRALRDLLETIGSAEPTPLQAGLIHHLRIKRVASVWGDPNTLAGFSALSLAASLHCAGAGRRHRRTGTGRPAAVALLTALPALSIPAALLAIVLSGSRGGVLDALLVLGCYALLGTRSYRPRVAVVVAAAAVFLAAGRPSSLPASPVTTAPVTQASEPVLFSSFLTRIDTIRERVHYVRVGLAITARNPVFGSGPGAVDLYYGHYKPAEARESKYLHNWPLQIAAEYGLAGLILACGFAAGLLRPALWRRARGPSPLRPALVMAAVFLFDALLQFSFNQREMMALFGLLTGALLQGIPGKAAGGAGSCGHRFRIAVVALFLVAASLIHVVPALISLAEKEDAQDALDAGEVDEAIRHLRRASAWSPRDPYPLLSLGLIEAERKGPDAGALLVERALRLQPQSANLHARLAGLRLQSGRLGEAETLARRAVELYPTNAEHQDLLSRVLEASGNRDEALIAARRAAEYGYLYKEKYGKRLRELEKRQ